MHIAWALVLSYFNGRQDVSFGYMGSGRDAPIDGIDRICGPMANLLISRVDLASPLQSMLRSIAQNLKEHRRHQQTYFAPVFHKLGLGDKPLFNTMINLLRAEKEECQTDTLVKEKKILISPHEVGSHQNYSRQCVILTIIESLILLWKATFIQRPLQSRFSIIAATSRAMWHKKFTLFCAGLLIFSSNRQLNRI